ncbi:MAG: hypothetical protein RAO92_08300 [Candidatus Euphemobacter frigidus]|nr:hypothetical protein [Candidatus Euphemobacter frigidus]MDP8276388.1 hypothetical protein [Candidatus Euphemobacter frigidus]
MIKKGKASSIWSYFTPEIIIQKKSSPVYGITLKNLRMNYEPVKRIEEYTVWRRNDVTGGVLNLDIGPLLNQSEIIIDSAVYAPVKDWLRIACFPWYLHLG